MVKFQIGFFIIALAVFVGCGRHSKFSDQVVKADRLVITKVIKGRGSVSMSLEGEEARSVVAAIVSGELCGDVPPPVEAARMEFFKGTNGLGTVYFHDGIFWTKDGEYADHTGPLRRLEKSLSEKQN